jgi:hypothetical protein
MPTARIVTVVPDTVQTGTVAEAKLTASPELAVAVSAKGAVNTVTVPGRPNAMDCDAGATVKLCTTGLAAGTFTLPG